MAQKLKGVGGVLGNLISPEPVTPEPQATPAEAVPAASPPPSVPPAEEIRPRSSTPSSTTRSRGARRGRPPGQKTGEGGDKEKITLRISKTLADEYRDWSWEERCQLGELVEKALIHYRRNRDRKKGE